MTGTYRLLCRGFLPIQDLKAQKNIWWSPTNRQWRGRQKSHTYLYGFPLTIAALHVSHFATQLSSLIMNANHFCSTLFFRVQRIEPLFLALSEKYLGYETAIQMWKQMQNSPLCYDFFSLLTLNHLLI